MKWIVVEATAEARGGKGVIEVSGISYQKANSVWTLNPILLP